MAYARKAAKSGYKSYKAKPRARKAAPKRRTATKRAAPRQQTVKIVLEYAPSAEQQRMAGAQLSPLAPRRAMF
jgi:hypothetical protein